MLGGPQSSRDQPGLQMTPGHRERLSQPPPLSPAPKQLNLRILILYKFKNKYNQTWEICQLQMVVLSKAPLLSENCKWIPFARKAFFFFKTQLVSLYFYTWSWEYIHFMKIICLCLKKCLKKISLHIKVKCLFCKVLFCLIRCLVTIKSSWLNWWNRISKFV